MCVSYLWCIYQEISAKEFVSSRHLFNNRNKYRHGHMILALGKIHVILTVGQPVFLLLLYCLYG